MSGQEIIPVGESPQLPDLIAETTEIVRWGGPSIEDLFGRMGMTIEPKGKEVILDFMEDNRGTYYQPYMKCDHTCQMQDSCPMKKAGIDVSGQVDCPLEKILAMQWFNDLASDLNLSPTDTATIQYLKMMILSQLKMRKLDAELAKETEWMYEEVSAVDPQTGTIYYKKVMVPVLRELREQLKSIGEQLKQMGATRKDMLDRNQEDKKIDMQKEAAAMKAAIEVSKNLGTPDAFNKIKFRTEEELSEG